MVNTPMPDLPAGLTTIVQQFQIDGTFIDLAPHGSGHINDTYLGRYQTAHGVERFIHQRINHQVFRQPEKVMGNIERVTRYAREQIQAAGGDPSRETLTLVPTRAGASFFRTPAGEYWRTYRFIRGVHTCEVATEPRQAYHAARAFGRFQKLLDSLPGERLHETIPNFHHTGKRFAAFQQAVRADVHHRAQFCRAEIDFILQRQADAAVVVDMLDQGLLPERVTHNDTKLNNVLMDDQTGEGICVIDLDTMMPGSALYDFGDLIRMGTATAPEDEPDLSKVSVDLNMFDWLARGYLEAARDFLTPQEWQYLPFGGKLITFEQAIRFLGDYIQGDVYYKIHRPGHNLDRARNQIKMVADMEQKMDQMQAIVARCQTA